MWVTACCDRSTPNQRLLRIDPVGLTVEHQLDLPGDGESERLGVNTAGVYLSGEGFSTVVHVNPTGTHIVAQVDVGDPGSPFPKPCRLYVGSQVWCSVGTTGQLANIGADDQVTLVPAPGVVQDLTIEGTRLVVSTDQGLFRRDGDAWTPIAAPALGLLAESDRLWAVQGSRCCSWPCRVDRRPQPLTATTTNDLAVVPLDAAWIVLRSPGATSTRPDSSLPGVRLPRSTLLFVPALPVVEVARGLGVVALARSPSATSLSYASSKSSFPTMKLAPADLDVPQGRDRGGRDRDTSTAIMTTSTCRSSHPPGRGGSGRQLGARLLGHHVGGVPNRSSRPPWPIRTSCSPCAIEPWRIVSRGPRPS